MFGCIAGQAGNRRRFTPYLRGLSWSTVGTPILNAGAGGPIRQNVALARQSGSIVILEIENRSGKESALFEVVEAFENRSAGGFIADAEK